MPYKHSEKKIPRHLDRRVKLTDGDKTEILRLFKIEQLPIREIARRFEGKCSRRTIQYIIYPERLETVREQFKERRKDGRYKPTKDDWRKTMREHRHYKQSIKNKLI